jgi:hypothetical protein
VIVPRNGVFLEKEFLSRGFSWIKVRLKEIRDESVRGESTKALVDESVVEPELAVALEPRRFSRL